LLARLLVFKAFLSVGIGVEAEDLRKRWTYLQFVPKTLKTALGSKREDIFASVFDVLKDFNPMDDIIAEISSRFDSIRLAHGIVPGSEGPFFTVLDDCQEFVDLHYGLFPAKRRGSRECNGSRRSVLRELNLCWDTFVPQRLDVRFSGTSLDAWKCVAF
jgi:hypothetical protein